MGGNVFVDFDKAISTGVAKLDAFSQQENGVELLVSIFKSMEFEGYSIGPWGPYPAILPKLDQANLIRAEKIYANVSDLFGGSFQLSRVNCQLVDDHNAASFSVEGMLECRDRCVRGSLNGLVLLKWNEGEYGGSFEYHVLGSQEQVKAALEAIFAKYAKDLIEAKNDNEKKLNAILECCQTICQLQPFPYGNEAVVNVLFSKLLHENNLPEFCPVRPTDFLLLDREHLLSSVKANQKDACNWLPTPLKKHIQEKIPGLNPEQVWRLVVDSRAHDQGRFVFDAKGEGGERGYLSGMMNGFEHMLSTLDNKLSVDLVLGLHDACVENVRHKSTMARIRKEDLRSILGDSHEQYCEELWSLLIEKGVVAEEFRQMQLPDRVLIEMVPHLLEMDFPAHLEKYRQPLFDFAKDASKFRCGFRPQGFESAVPLSSPTEAGIQELQKEIETGLLKNWCELIRNNKVLFIKPAVSAEVTREHVQKICDNFNEKISKEVTQEAKLYAIAECVWYLEHSHVFTDANLRTSVFLIMNKLLLQNGFSPVLADDPNIIDGRSKEETVQCIKQWQAAYKAMVEKFPRTAAAVSALPTDGRAANQVNTSGVNAAGSLGLFSAEETQRRASAAARQANKSSTGQIDTSKMSSTEIHGRFGKH